MNDPSALIVMPHDAHTYPPSFLLVPLLSTYQIASHLCSGKLQRSELTKVGLVLSILNPMNVVEWKLNCGFQLINEQVALFIWSQPTMLNRPLGHILRNPQKKWFLHSSPFLRRGTQYEVMRRRFAHSLLLMFGPIVQYSVLSQVTVATS